MSRDVGVVRHAEGLTQAREEVDAIAAALRVGSTRETLAGDAETRRAFWELRNLIDAAQAVIAAADHRQESRGAHYHADFPEPEPSLEGQHSLSAGDGSFRYGTLDKAFTTAAR
jgi:nicotinate-nucleotide pyrophosphorylase (carboxylating)